MKGAVNQMGMYSMNLIYANEQRKRKLKDEEAKEKAQAKVVEEISIQEAETKLAEEVEQPDEEKPKPRKKKGEK